MLRRAEAWREHVPEAHRVGGVRIVLGADGRPRLADRRATLPTPGDPRLRALLDTDYGMDWMWGDCGVLQYWITLEDLTALRFDRVHVRLECT